MPSPEQNAAFENFVLAQLRIARAKARLLVNEIDAIGIALRDHAITPDQALGALYAARSLAFLHTEPMRAPSESFADDPDDPCPSPPEANGGAANGRDEPSAPEKPSPADLRRLPEAGTGSDR